MAKAVAIATSWRGHKIIKGSQSHVEILIVREWEKWKFYRLLCESNWTIQANSVGLQKWWSKGIPTLRHKGASQDIISNWVSDLKGPLFPLAERDKTRWNNWTTTRPQFQESKKILKKINFTHEFSQHARFSHLLKYAVGNWESWHHSQLCWHRQGKRHLKIKLFAVEIILWLSLLVWILQCRRSTLQLDCNCKEHSAET